MAENKLSYLTRNYDEYKQGLIEITKQYYPDVFADLNDASVGQWLIELLADMGDSLQYHLDRVVQETSLESAREYSSIQDMARTAGLKLPYKKAAMVEVELSCTLPLTTQGPNGKGDMMADESYAPKIKRGTKFSNGTTTFELNEDIDFTEQFNEDGLSNRQIIPLRNSNGNIISYTYKKLSTASACQSKILKKIISSSEIKPFMEFTIEDTDVIGVESVLVREGVTSSNTDPKISTFYEDNEVIKVSEDKVYKRFFEVDNLLDQERFGVENVANQPTWEEVYEDVIEEDEEGNKEIIGKAAVRKIAKGKWYPLKQKFITEYTDEWKLKLIFGAGLENQYGTIPKEASDFTQYQMSRMLANDYMGVLPKPNSTMYVLYRTGGGEISNIPAGTLNTIINLNIEIDGNCDDPENALKTRRVRQSLSVTNTTPSYGGKNAPSSEEIRYMLKYNAGAQNRCVTLKDYFSRVCQIPAKYGCPFRHNVIEENNKVVIYTLGLDADGKLLPMLSEEVGENIKEYLSHYRMINDFVEIKAGKVINLSFMATVYLDKAYDKSETTKRIIDMIYDYMDVQNHMMGEDIFIGDLQKEISKLDGVVNLVDLRVFNKIGEGYSDDIVSQPLVDTNSCCFDEYSAAEQESLTNGNPEIDLKSSDYMLFGDANTMYEIKNKNSDIVIIVKSRI